MNERTAVVIGASGLIGSLLVEHMLKDEYFDTVRALVRRELPFSNEKLKQEIVNFDDREDFNNKFGKGHSIFCCIGTTQKKVKGDKAAYEKIDHDIPVNAARIGTALGYKEFMIVSSVGADAAASNFYLRLKGKTEDDIKKFAFNTISIFRPSMLLGKRNEWRPAEKIGQVMMQAFSLVLIGSLKKYHPIQAEDVAGAMIAESKKAKPGIHILEYNEMMKLLH